MITCKEVHEEQRRLGWWDTPIDVTMKQVLIVTEVAEAIEGLRKDSMDDHLPHRKTEEVELADAVIRMMDILGHHHIEHEIRKYNVQGVKESQVYYDIISYICSYEYSEAINICYALAEKKGYNLDITIGEKMAYNRTRPYKHGKKF